MRLTDGRRLVRPAVTFTAQFARRRSAATDAATADPLVPIAAAGRPKTTERMKNSGVDYSSQLLMQARIAEHVRATATHVASASAVSGPIHPTGALAAAVHAPASAAGICSPVRLVEFI